MSPPAMEVGHGGVALDPKTVRILFDGRDVTHSHQHPSRSCRSSGEARIATVASLDELAALLQELRPV